jgi:hypothetical protein
MRNWTNSIGPPSWIGWIIEIAPDGDGFDALWGYSGFISTKWTWIKNARNYCCGKLEEF